MIGDKNVCCIVNNSSALTRRDLCLNIVHFFLLIGLYTVNVFLEVFKRNHHIFRAHYLVFKRSFTPDSALIYMT